MSASARSVIGKLPAKAKGINLLEANAPEIFTCHKCRKSFDTPYDLNRHALTHGEKQIYCAFLDCEFHTHQLSNLRVHLFEAKNTHPGTTLEYYNDLVAARRVEEELEHMSSTTFRFKSKYPFVPYSRSKKPRATSAAVPKTKVRTKSGPPKRRGRPPRERNESHSFGSDQGASSWSIDPPPQESVQIPSREPSNFSGSPPFMEPEKPPVIRFAIPTEHDEASALPLYTFWGGPNMNTWNNPLIPVGLDRAPPNSVEDVLGVVIQPSEPVIDPALLHPTSSFEDDLSSLFLATSEMDVWSSFTTPFASTI